MNLPTLYGQIQSFSCDSFYMGRPRRHYVTLPGSTEGYGEHTQTHTFEITLTTHLPGKLTAVFPLDNDSQGGIINTKAALS